VRAAGAIIQYLRETQIQGLTQITGLATIARRRHDAGCGHAAQPGADRDDSRRSSQGSLLGVLDSTRTPMARGSCERGSASRCSTGSNRDAPGARGGVRAGHAGARICVGRAQDMPDLERQATRVLSGAATPRDLLAIRRALEQTPALRAAVESASPGSSRESGERSPLAALLAELEPCDDVSSLIAQAINEDAPAALSTGGVIRPGFSAELDGILIASRDAKTWVANLEKTERERTASRRSRWATTRSLAITRSDARQCRRRA